MRVHHLLLVAALATSGSAALATQLYHPSESPEEGMKFTPEHRTSTLSRSEVRQSVLAAQRDGTLYWISRGYPGNYPTVAVHRSEKSRQQVLDELRAWRKNPMTADGMRQINGEIGWADARQAP